MTMSPASSSSPPICCAMVNELIAVGEAKMPSSDTNSTPRKPSSAAADNSTAGTTTSFPSVTVVSSRRYCRSPSNRKNAPSKNSCSGVAALPIPLTAETRKPGSVIFSSSARIPSAELMMSGFFKICTSTFSGWGRPLRNTSSTTTDSTLKIGTITAIRMETGPRSASPSRALAIGIPIMT